ncbi:hypothetical protein [Umezakia ovalisporum]|jgi:hypothetical protein|uniref:hypothetical protein n=1 Tax=Umezakia ovalisporum TaxID=75695 RepID=UPI000A620095|nr:hypothetical protein [Umezakia ovalisporum]MBI1240944.1 hypothetical protein [Nostoc sp. RI_552]MDH6083791.1 hypothetical protein [Umezakia ovalisporum TAC611]MDH6088868.1 hypothetical protein [Umezakia ovalisporum Ak1311]
MGGYILPIFTGFQVVFWLLGWCLAFVPQGTAAQVRVAGGVNKMVVGDLLPPVEYERFFRGYEVAQVDEYGGRGYYLVYVNSGSAEVLERVRLFEPDAYVRVYEGRAVIQLGVFREVMNAEGRVRFLQSQGVGDVRMVRVGDGSGVSAGFGGEGSGVSMAKVGEGFGYYAVIPGDAEDLPLMADYIRRRSGFYGLVLERQRPLGPHVAVGPFKKREEAKVWSKYLRGLGYGDARVYYGW